MATPAWGHAAYKDSDPADGATVSSAPSNVTAEFTEPLAGGSYLKVYDPCGRQVDAGDVSMVGYEMSVSMSGTAAGAYRVHFRAHSQLDPHVTEGDFGFTATEGEPCLGAETGTGTGSDQGSGGGSGDGGDSGAETVSTATGGGGSSSTDAGAGGGGGGAGGGGANAGPGARRATFPKPGRERAQVPNIAAGRDDQADEERSVWDGIRLESYLTGLLLAAVIGAAGGKIYAGIMGPRA